VEGGETKTFELKFSFTGTWSKARDKVFAATGIDVIGRAPC